MADETMLLIEERQAIDGVEVEHVTAISCRRSIFRSSVGGDLRRSGAVRICVRERMGPSVVGCDERVVLPLLFSRGLQRVVVTHKDGLDGVDGAEALVWTV